MQRTILLRPPCRVTQSFSQLPEQSVAIPDEVSLSGGAWQWCELDTTADNQPMAMQTGAVTVKDCQAILFLPASCFVIRKLSLPNLSKKQLQTAVPYAIEEDIAGDVADLHIVVSPPDSNQMRLVVAIERQMLQGILDHLDQSEIAVTHCWPDALCLGEIEETPSEPWLSILPSGNDMVVNHSNSAFYCLQPDELEWFMQQQVAATPNNLEKIIHLGNQPLPDFLSRADGVQSKRSSSSPLSVMYQGMPDVAMNLLQGEFLPRDKSTTPIKWRSAAIAAGVLLLLTSAYALTDYWLLEQEKRDSTAELDTVFKSKFPNIQNVIQPRVQAEREINAMQGQSDDTALHLVSVIAPILSRYPNLQLVALNYDQQRLRVELVTDQISQFDELEKSLKTHALNVVNQGVIRDGAEVRGELLVSLL